MHITSLIVAASFSTAIMALPKDIVSGGTNENPVPWLRVIGKDDICGKDQPLSGNLNKTKGHYECQELKRLPGEALEIFWGPQNLYADGVTLYTKKGCKGESRKIEVGTSDWSHADTSSGGNQQHYECYDAKLKGDPKEYKSFRAECDICDKGTEMVKPEAYMIRVG